MMKKSFLLFFIFFLNFSVFAQFEVLTNQKIFYHSYPFIVETPNYYIYSFTKYTEDLWHPKYHNIYKLSKTGEIVDSLMIDNFLCHDFIHLNDEKLLLAGGYSSVEDSMVIIRPRFITIDENLNIVSMDSLDLPSNFSIDSIWVNTPMSQGTICVQIKKNNNGFTALISTDLNQYYLYQLDDNLDCLHTRVFDHTVLYPLLQNNYYNNACYLFSKNDVFKFGNNNLDSTFVTNLEYATNDDGIDKLLTIKHINKNRMLIYFDARIHTEENGFDEQVGIYLVDSLFNLKKYTYIGYSTDTLDSGVAQSNGIDFIDPNHIFVVSNINYKSYNLTPKDRPTYHGEYFR